MTIYRGRYYSASGCDGSPRPGTRAMMSWYLGAYRNRSAANLGTYACKRLGSGWSIHAQRRALDLGTSPYGGVDSTWGWAMANAMRRYSKELGIQLIILGRRIWSCTYPDSGWRNYYGEYHGHAHVELIPSAANTLTADKIERFIHGKGEDDVDLNDKVELNQWVQSIYPGLKQVSVETAIGTGYAVSRLAKDRVTQGVREILAGQAAILARIDGANDGDTRQIVREELERYGDRFMTVIEQIPQEVAAELGDRDSAEIQEALGRVLDRVRVEVKGDEQEGEDTP